MSSRMRRSVPRRLGVAAATLAACGVLAGCGGGGDDDTTSTTSAAAPTTTTEAAAPTTTATTSQSRADAPGGCLEVDAPAPRTSEPSVPKPKPSKLTGTHTVTMQTTCGNFTIRLDAKNQPKTSASFASLVKEGFYDGLTFQRIVPGFVIQGGDPLGDGTGGPGYSVRESVPKGEDYPDGTIAMAKTGAEAPGTSGSQFFVVLPGGGQQLAQQPDYAVAGKVTSGMDTVNRIAAIGTDDPQGAQAASRTVIIKKATLDGGK